MTELCFPFWIVTGRLGLIAKPVAADGTPDFVAAFSTAQNAASFMVGRGATKWENHLVVRSTLVSLIDKLRLAGVRGLCIDPARDEPGVQFTFEEIEETP